MSETEKYQAITAKALAVLQAIASAPPEETMATVRLKAIVGLWAAKVVLTEDRDPSLAEMLAYASQCASELIAWHQKLAGAARALTTIDQQSAS